MLLDDRVMEEMTWRRGSANADVPYTSGSLGGTNVLGNEDLLKWERQIIQKEK